MSEQNEELTQEIVNEIFEQGKSEWDKRLKESGLTQTMFISTNHEGFPVEFLAHYQMAKEGAESQGFTMPVLVEGVEVKLSDADDEDGVSVDIEETVDVESINHSDMVAQLAKPGQDIVDQLTAADAHTLHMAVGISGESGELLDAVKKAVMYRKQIDMENIIEELGDLEFYMEGLRQGLGITREETIEANIEKLGKRYKGHQYSDQQAQDRADKSIEQIQQLDT